MSDEQTEIQGCFRAFQQEIDAYNDRRERLIKSSRDITAASKKVIFSLHRFPHQALFTSSNRQRSNAAIKILADAHAKKNEIVQMVMQAAKREHFDQEKRTEKASSDQDIEIGRATRYERAIGSGIEEFVSFAVAIEALRFQSSLLTLYSICIRWKQSHSYTFSSTPH